MTSYICKFARKQEVTIYVEAPDKSSAREAAKNLAREFLSFDDEQDDELKEDLVGGTVKITTVGCSGEVTKYAVSEECDVQK